jgi:hypothetical protein
MQLVATLYCHPVKKVLVCVESGLPRNFPGSKKIKGEIKK